MQIELRRDIVRLYEKYCKDGRYVFAVHNTYLAAIMRELDIPLLNISLFKNTPKITHLNKIYENYKCCYIHAQSTKHYNCSHRKALHYIKWLS